MNLNPLFNNAITKGSQVINYQSVRWRRVTKPFWLGLAKSKMFVLREPKVYLTPEESAEYNKLLIHYNTEYKSIVNFICNESPKWKNVAETDEKEKLKICPELQENIKLSLIANEKWNAESKRLGEQYSEKVLEKEADKAKALIEEKSLEEQQYQEKLEELLAKEKAVSENYITPENLDEAIDKCLQTVEEFDFAIDLEGNKYYGRESLESKETKNKMEENVVLEEGGVDGSKLVPEPQ